MKQKYTYPELYYSTKVEKALKAMPKLPEKPIEPTPPPKPINPGEFDGGGNMGCSIIGIIASIIMFCISVSADEVKFSVIICSILLFFCALFFYKTESWDKDSHKEKTRKYNKVTRDYPNLLKKYEDALAKYQAEKKLYDEKVSFLISEKNLASYRAKQITAMVDSLVSIPMFKKCDENDIVKVGASENYFVEQLKSNTDFTVYINKKVSVGSTYYYPDIICVINGLYFDIEIDEPYVGSDGTPIHYIENKYGILTESVDSKRNEYMVEKGWNIIRFSEEQIFLYTNECIEYICSVVNSIIEGTEIIKIKDYFITKKWDKEQSHKMSYKRFRRTYIPPKYHSNIDKEEYYSYSEIRNEVFNNDNTEDTAINYIDDLPF